MRQLAACLGAFLACALLAACTRSEIQTGRDGLRTFTIVEEIGGSPVLCPLGAPIPPLSGMLAGDPNDRERVWLVVENGRRVSIVWPAGFRAGFEPAAVLYNESGRAVARAGQAVVLDQVSPGDAEGSFEDPYIAGGILFGGCYPFIP